MNAQRLRPLFPALCITMLLAGCASLPRAADPAMPAQWPARASSSQVGAPLQLPATQRWWDAFNDPVLSDLIAQSFQRNTDLASAALRVRNASLRAGAATQAMLPTPGGSAGRSDSRAAPMPGAPDPAWQHGYSGSLSVGWELDLWGRLKDQRSVARWERDATEDDRIGVALSLSGNVARQYWQWLALEARIDAAQRGIALAERTLQMTRVQYRAGAISGLDLTQAEQSLLGQQSALRQLQAQQHEARNNFSLLFDLPPGQLPRLPTPMPNVVELPVPDVPVGVPADVLTQRPDLRAAQKRLESTLLNVRITRKSFLPGVSLNGGIATGGAHVGDILRNPSQSLGIGLSLPFLNIGELIRAPKVARNDYQIAVLGYRQSVYRALGEADSALASLTALQQQLRMQQTAVENARRIERLNGVRYRAGAVPLRAWLDAQEALRQAEMQLVETRVNALQAASGAWIALGGSLDAGDIAAAQQ